MTQTGEIGEAVEKGEIVEIASIDAVVMHVAEKRVGWQKRLGEYATLSPTVAFHAFCLGKPGVLCATIVPESNAFMSLGLALSEKQIPRFVGNVGS
ncbi:MAG: hypothetical protein WCD68_12105 [Candidatus Acidiferrum sp.]